MILWLPINVELRHLRGKKKKKCIVAVNGPTMIFFFFQGLARTHTCCVITVRAQTWAHSQTH